MGRLRFFCSVAVAVGALQCSVLCGEARAVAAGGEPARPSEWASILLLRAGSVCSAVIVGPHAILTSVQCVESGFDGSATFKVGAEGYIPYSMDCSASERAQVALCRTHQAVPTPVIERLSTSPAAATGKVTLVGYGCRDSVARNFDGILSFGIAEVVKPVRAGEIFTVLQGATACAGDAGGGVFAQSDGRRYLIGMMSRTDSVSRTWMVATAADEFLRFAKQWSAQHNVPICGLGTGEQGCVPLESEVPPIGPLTSALRTALEKRIFLSRPEVAVAPPPVRQVKYRSGDFLKHLVQLTCLNAGDEIYYMRVLAYLAQKGQPLKSDHRFSEAGILEVPVCPQARGSEDVITIEIKPSDPNYLWYYYKQLLKDKKIQGKWLWEYKVGDVRVSPERTKKFSPYYVEVFRELNPEQDPNDLKPGRIILPVRPNVGEATVLSGNFTGRLEPIRVLQAMEGGCGPRQEALAYPFDVFALLEILGANSEARKTEISAARVAIVDSGLFGAEREASIVRGNSLYLNELPRSVINERLPTYARSARALTDPLDSLHGTWVASTVLGGPIFARMQAAAGGRPRIKIDPFPVYESRLDGTAIPAQRFMEFFGQLEKHRSAGLTVINLSLRTDNEVVVSPILERLQNTGPNYQNYLFVVAAGNGKGTGADNTGQPLAARGEAGAMYPSAFGGRSPRLIVVGALYWTEKNRWERAKFSDFGPNIVELGAPGCSVPVVDYDTDEEAWIAAPRLVNGTSFAAPLVSFASALIHSEMPKLTAAAVKKRLLAAADLNPHLVDDIADGRSLNVIKAAAVFYDAIETDGRTKIGHLQFMEEVSGVEIGTDGEFGIKCEGRSDDKIKLRTILKIRPSFNVEKHSVAREKTGLGEAMAKEFPDRVYVDGAEGEALGVLNCKLPDGIVMHFRRLGAEGAPQYNWNEVRDIVLRVPENR